MLNLLKTEARYFKKTLITSKNGMLLMVLLVLVSLPVTVLVFGDKEKAETETARQISESSQLTNLLTRTRTARIEEAPGIFRISDDICAPGQESCGSGFCAAPGSCPPAQALVTYAPPDPNAPPLPDQPETVTPHYCRAGEQQCGDWCMLVSACPNNGDWSCGAGSNGQFYPSCSTTPPTGDSKTNLFIPGKDVTVKQVKVIPGGSTPTPIPAPKEDIAAKPVAKAPGGGGVGGQVPAVPPKVDPVVSPPPATHPCQTGDDNIPCPPDPFQGAPHPCQTGDDNIPCPPAPKAAPPTIEPPDKSGGELCLGRLGCVPTDIFPNKIPLGHGRSVSLPDPDIIPSKDDVKKALSLFKLHADIPILDTAEPNLKVSLSIPGIGGDVSLGQNNTPVTNYKLGQIAVINTETNQVASNGAVLFVYDSSTFSFDTLVNVPPGTYSIYAGLDNTLFRTIGSAQIGAAEIDSSQNISALAVVSGDLDQNNTLDLLDYTLLISCYGTKSCEEKEAADFNLDGKVDELDLNIFFSGLTNREGE